MDTVLEIDDNFDFTKLSLGQPQPFQGGSFFTKITYNGHDLQIQFPKCKTKQGINQSEKKYFTDLLYETIDSSELTSWIETLESTCQKLIYSKRDMWFHSQIELNDIETAFTNSARLYKSGKQFLIRCHFNKLQNNKQSVIIYDEDEKLLNIQDVTSEKDIIPLLKIEGIKFSTRSFQIEYNLTQIMVLKEYEDVSHCMIKHNKPAATQNNLGVTPTTLSLTQLETKQQEQSTSILKPEVLSLPMPVTSINSENLENEKNINTINHSKNDKNNETIEVKQEKDLIKEKNRENITKIVNEEENTLVNTISEKLPEKQSDDLEQVEISFNEIQDEIKLRKPNEVYYEIYRAAREKAKLAKIAAIEAYLEAKSIKTKYMLDDLDESLDDDSEYMEDLSER